jgi:Adaptin N terminal region
MRDIFRKYPNKYENSLGQLLENVNIIKEPEAKASLIWIIGEYVQSIQGSGAILSKFLETFNEESS